MDFFFEDEADEVGSDVEAYCPKCRADTTHVVISKYEDEIRRVQCNPCGDVHSFRKPRGEVEEDMPEPAAVKKRATAKKLSWEEFFAKHSEKNAKPYEFRETYRENNILLHPKFGVGFVSELLPDNKVEATFKDGRRFLVHNRKDIPGLPLAAEGDGTPTPKPAKGTKPAPGKPAAAAPGKPPAAEASPKVAAPAPKAAVEQGKVAVKIPSKAGKAGEKTAPAKTAPAKTGPAKTAAKTAPKTAAKPAKSSPAAKIKASAKKKPSKPTAKPQKKR
jgi:hypothetical protein